MAKRLVNKSEEIRNEIIANPGLRNKDIQDNLASRGIEVASAMVSTVRQKMTETPAAPADNTAALFPPTAPAAAAPAAPASLPPVAASAVAPLLGAEQLAAMRQVKALVERYGKSQIKALCDLF